MTPTYACRPTPGATPAPTAHDITRRRALQLAVLGLAAGASACAKPKRNPSAVEAAPLFSISLAEWSLHRTIRAGQLDHLDFPRTTKKIYGIDAVEYVNQFFRDKARDSRYLAQLKKRCDDLGVRSLLIMIDGEGDLGHPNPGERTRAVENHCPWVTAAAALGCHSIRVNAASSGTREEQMKLAADGLRRLCEFADPHGINVIVENHGGLSSHGDWLAAVIRLVDHPRCGTLPDFGNFYEYDRYQGVADMMPFAKGVSAKSHDFDEQGNEIHTDYRRMLKIVLSAGYRGHIGIEYEGERLSEQDGIRRTKALLEKVRAEFT